MWRMENNKTATVLNVSSIEEDIMMDMPKGIRVMKLAIMVISLAIVGGCDNKRKQLLCQTDHPALLMACREILALAANGELKAGRYNIGWNPPSPELSCFPKLIIDLAPSYVVIHGDGHLSIEMHGGFDHFGVHAFADDFKEHHPDFDYFNRELVDGLWYYDEEYISDPDYGKKIDRILSGRTHGGQGGADLPAGAYGQASGQRWVRERAVDAAGPADGRTGTSSCETWRAVGRAFGPGVNMAMS